MSDYAIYDKNNIVVNVIVAETPELAEEISGLNAIETNGQPWIGWVLLDGVWTPPYEDPWIDARIIDGVWVQAPPYESWEWDGNQWLPPVPYPQETGLFYQWDEPTLSWIMVDPPYESWQWDGERWQPPVPFPVDTGLSYDWDEDTLSWKLIEGGL